MQWPEAVTSVFGIAGILGAMYLKTIDGLATNTVVLAIIAIAGLGGYKLLRDYLEAKGGV